jgi:hypothetical protein
MKSVYACISILKRAGKIRKRKNKASVSAQRLPGIKKTGA